MAKANSKAISLPTSPNKPPPNLWDYNWMIYGEKGIGKSTLAALFPDIVAYFMAEPYRRGLQVPMIPDFSRGEEPLTWARMLDYQKLILDKYDGGRIVGDSLDQIALLCERYICVKKGVDSIAGLNDYGKTWDALNTEWQQYWGRFMSAGFYLTLTSHSRYRPRLVRGIKREDIPQAVKDGLIINQVQPTCRGWAFDWSKVVCEFAAYYGYLGQYRVLTVRGNESTYASSGVGETHFIQPKGCDRAGEPYDMFPVGTSAKQAYKTLTDAWNNKVEGWFAEESYEVPEESS